MRQFRVFTAQDDPRMQPTRVEKALPGRVWRGGALALLLWLALGVTRAQAYRPANWLWFNWPYAYDLDQASWYYFSEQDAFWSYAVPPGPGWEPLASLSTDTQSLAHGWAYMAWPYAYDAESTFWHYLNEGNVQWCLNMTSGEWSRFGVEPPLPPAPPVPYNFNGTGASDFATYERDFGLWRIRNGDGSTRTHFHGTPAATPVAGDYDGDGITDVAVFNKNSTVWSILRSTNTQTLDIAFGDPDAFPVPGDYDGDRLTDLAVYYRETGEWQVRYSASSNQVFAFMFGGPFYRPVPADYDGDGKTDLALYLAAFGQWLIIESKTWTLVTQSLGNSQSIPVPAPYDRDRRADPAVYDPDSATYRILQSTNRRLRLAVLGGSASVPVPADYDGDTFADVAVYTPVTGRWDYQQSSDLAMRNRTYGQEFARAIPAYANGAVEGLRIHCHGDSITYGKSSASDGPETGYPRRMERKLQGDYGGDIITLNYGHPGEITGSGLDRLPSDLNTTRARVLLIMEGTNDHSQNVPFDRVEQNLREMVLHGLTRGMKVVIATIPPVLASQRPDQARRIREFNPRIYTIARDYGIPVARVYEYITAVPGWENTLMDKNASNHPNDAGYEYVRQAFVDALTPSLNGAELR